MSVPSSVTKITKDGVEFTSNVDRVNYTMKELCRAALRDVEEAIATIISGGDAIGAVVMYGKGEKEFLGTAERQLVISAANFLGRQME